MRVSLPRSLDRRIPAGLALLGLLACARMGSPPGGPPDKVPPKLVATVPESVGVYTGWRRDVEFHFDEIVSEGSTPNQGLGTGDLEKLILLSPSAKVPVIHWHRDRISVRPREGWKPNRVYRVELLPGLMDLRRNRLDTTAVLTFSTGGPLPTDTLRGLAIDWVQDRVAAGALVELVLRPDSLVYRTVTDSGGRFAVGPLPEGEYLVYGTVDQNHDQRRGRRESYDSALVRTGQAVPPLWMIPRDSAGPRITSVTLVDSVSALIGFGGPLAPGQHFDSTNVTLLNQSDSTPVPFLSVLPKELDDSLQKSARARADSIRVAQDTTIPDSLKRPRPARAQPKPPALQGPGRARVDPVADSILRSRPRLSQTLVLRVDSAFAPEAKYLIGVSGARTAAGVPGDAKGVLAVPKRPPPPPARDSTVADSSKVRLGNPADSLRPIRADSLKRRKRPPP